MMIMPVSADGKKKEQAEIRVSGKKSQSLLKVVSKRVLQQPKSISTPKKFLRDFEELNL